ncbi:MAG: hypothetical protein WCF03_14840 [Nitrososphaeraceae archaeon]
MKHNPQFINAYKDVSTKTTKYSNRIEDTQRRTKDKVNHLIDLGLMKIVYYTKESKGTSLLPLYEYTKLGLFFAFLIESYDPNKRASAESEIYDLFVNSMFRIKEYSSSYNIFYHSFFNKSKENGFFGDIIWIFRQVLDSGKRIMTAEVLFSLSLFPRFKDEDKERLFLKIWALTIRCMDQKTRESFYLHLNLKLREEWKGLFLTPNNMKKYSMNIEIELTQ